jgi:DNA-binding protein H-NS
MTRTYAQVMKQIEGLQAQADKLRQKEIEGVVARIREAIEHYRLTAADLGLDGGSKKAQPLRKRAAAKKSAAVPKYRDELGRTWGGRGKRPQWLRDALAAGKTLQDFEVH